MAEARELTATVHGTFLLPCPGHFLRQAMSRGLGALPDILGSDLQFSCFRTQSKLLGHSVPQFPYP